MHRRSKVRDCPQNNVSTHVYHTNIYMRNQASLCVLAHLGTACSSPKHVEWTGAKCKGYRWQSPRSLWLGWRFRVVCAKIVKCSVSIVLISHNSLALPTERIHCSFKPQTLLQTSRVIFKRWWTQSTQLHRSGDQEKWVCFCPKRYPRPPQMWTTHVSDMTTPDT